MRIVIVGPGAMGCIFAVYLQEAGHSVSLMDYRRDRAEVLNATGISIEGVRGEHRTRVPVVTEPDRMEPELAILCVKAYHTETAASVLRDWLPASAPVLTLQNGLGNLETLETLFGPANILGGVTSEGGTLLEPGHVRHAGTGETHIGALAGAGDDILSRVIGAMSQAGFTTRATKDLHGLIWGKLLVNVGINALAAITGLRNGDLPRHEGTRVLLEKAVKEALTVSQRKGIRLPFPEPVEKVLEVCRGTADNLASMLQDVLRKKRTEIAFINGAIAREGQGLGVETPVNEALTHLVRTLEASYGRTLRA